MTLESNNNGLCLGVKDTQNPHCPLVRLQREGQYPNLLTRPTATSGDSGSSLTEEEKARYLPSQVVRDSHLSSTTSGSGWWTETYAAYEGRRLRSAFHRKAVFQNVSLNLGRHLHRGFQIQPLRLARGFRHLELYPGRL